MNLPSSSQDQSNLNSWELLSKDYSNELEKAKKELNDIVILLDQSQLEVTKSQQRNATISAHLQQIQAQIETSSKADIRTTYDAALEAQQRLFVMRGQIDKLHSDRVHLEKYINMLERITPAFESAGWEKKKPTSDQIDIGKSIEIIELDFNKFKNCQISWC